ncbi:MAG: DsrE family protein [Aquificota bacterium]|nr:DsrE family protein [Aquificota bacterium]
MDRRSFFKIGAAAVALTAADKMASAANVKLRFEDMKKEAKINVIYHADFPQEKRFKTMLRNITNHLSVYDFDPFKIKIVVVSHGAGAKFLLKDLKGTKWAKEPIDQKALRTKMEELLQYGVEFYLCGITVKRAKLVGKLYDFVKIVPSGVGTVAHLQTLGYAYIKVQ